MGRAVSVVPRTVRRWPVRGNAEGAWVGRFLSKLCRGLHSYHIGVLRIMKIQITGIRSLMRKYCCNFHWFTLTSHLRVKSDSRLKMLCTTEYKSGIWTRCISKYWRATGKTHMQVVA